MSEEEVALLQKDIEDLLPANSAFLLVTLPIGVPATPSFVSNMEREDSTNVLRAILTALDQVN